MLGGGHGIAAMTLMLVIAQAAAVIQPLLQPFEFGGLSAASPAAPEFRRLNCTPNENPASEYCMQVLMRFSGTRDLTSVFLYNGKLQSMSLHASPMDTQTARQALIMKYGIECGPYTWCFATGKLTLESSGSTYGSPGIRLRYKDQVNMPPPPDNPAAKVDF